VPNHSTLTAFFRNKAAHATTLTLAAFALTAASFLTRPIPVSAQAAPNTLDFYTHNVQPIFAANCYRCHGAGNHRGSFQMDTYAGMMRGGHDGSVLTPGHPEQSLLLQLIRHEGPADDPMPMPPPPHTKLSDADIATVTTWIKAGAVMPQ
jgi:cytochrome c